VTPFIKKKHSLFIKQNATTFWVYLRQKDWQVVLDQRIGVDDGLVEVLVQDFPGKEKPKC
jgi:hypothetical protein